MEVDEIQSLQVSKFQRVSSNGSTTSTDNSSNPQKLASNRGNFELQNHVDALVGGVGGGGGGGGGSVRLCGWPSSRIVRVSRASGGKDRHSKVLTSKGLRDRRVRLSVGTAIQFYDLQDRLGYDQPSKAVEWLLKAAASSIDELPSLDPPFSGGISDGISDRKVAGDHGNDNVCSQAKSPACSSTSETSKGSGLSLSRSENRIKARERAREMASKKEKEKEIDSTRVSVLNQVNHMPENSTFTDLLTGGINTTTTTTTNDYLFSRTLQPTPNLIQIPQFNNHHHHQQQQQPPQHHHFSFLQDTFSPATGGGAGGGESYSLNFAMTASPTGAVALGGFSRGTLQSNLQSSLLPHHHHHHLQRFQSSSIDVPTSSNLPFFIVPNATVDHYPAAGGYHLSYGGDGGGRRSDHQKEKSKN